MNLVVLALFALFALTFNFQSTQAEHILSNFDDAVTHKQNSVTDDDFMKFLEDVYEHDHEEEKIFRDNEAWEKDSGGFTKTVPKTSVLDYLKYVPDSESVEELDYGNLYDLLNFLSSEDSIDQFDSSDWSDSTEENYQDNDEYEDTLLATELLEEILDAKKDKKFRLNDLDFEDFFEEEIEQNKNENDDKLVDGDDVLEDEDIIEGAMKISDEKKEREQAEEVHQNEEKAIKDNNDAIILNPDDKEETNDVDKKEFTVDRNDVDELRSLLTQLANSEDSKSSESTDSGEDKTEGDDDKTEDDSESSSETSDDNININVKFPGVSVTRDDTYLCTAVKVSDYTNSTDKSLQIVGYVPHAKQTVAHHMLLYGCKSPGIKQPGAVWNCGGQMAGEIEKDGFLHASLCASGGKSTILWAWAKDAPAFTLPEDVGFKIGRGTNVQYIVLQVHYKSAKVFRGGMKDHSAVTVLATQNKRPRLAGVYILGTAMGTVQPRSTNNFDIACKYNRPFTIHPFAFRTHTHALGVEVIGFRIRDSEWTLIGAKNPQLPEAFYPVEAKNMTIRYGDILAARCEMANFRNIPTSIGFKHTDEMCNFYIMFWVDAKYEKALDRWNKSCFNGFPWIHWSTLPGYSI